MSEQEPAGPYVYNPKGVSEARIFAVAGIDRLRPIEGLTKAEAEWIVAELARLRALLKEAGEAMRSMADGDDISARDVDAFHAVLAKIAKEGP